MSSDLAQILIGVLGLVVNGVGLTFVAVQLAIGRRQANRAQLEQEAERVRLKRQATLDFATESMQVRHQLRAELPDDYDEERIRELINDCIKGLKPNSEKLIAMYLGYMESFAVAVSIGIYDLETADSLFGSRIVAIWKNYRPYIEFARSVRGRRHICRELQWLAGALDEFRKRGAGYDLAGNYIPAAKRVSQ